MNICYNYNHSFHSSIGKSPIEKLMTETHNVNSILDINETKSCEYWTEGNKRFEPYSNGTFVFMKIPLKGH